MTTQKKGRLVMVRHGQTSANIDQIWHGRTDTALTDLGHQQAQWLAEYFHHIMIPDVIYASPLQRAHNTAKAIGAAHNIEVITDPRLQEFDLGDWEGLQFEAINTVHDPDNQLVSNTHFSPPNGESQQRVQARMLAAIDDISSKHQGQHVVVVSHGVALAITLSHFQHNDTTKWMEYAIKNTAFSEICPQEKTLLSFNQTPHYQH